MQLKLFALQKKAALLDRERALIARNLPLIIDFFARHKVRGMHEASARDGWADAGTSLDRARDGCGRALLQDVFAFEPPLAGCIAYPRLRGTRSSLAFCTQLVESTGCVVEL